MFADERRAARQRVEAIEIERDAGAPGHRDQVDDRIGRSAERHGGGDGVVERLGRHDVARRQVFPHHLDDAAARGRGHARMRRSRPRESTTRRAASSPAPRPPPPSSRPCPSSCTCRTSARCRPPSRATRSRRSRRRASRPSTSRRRCRCRASGRASCRAASARPARRSPAGSSLVAPISSAGTVLSQPPSRTTPSAGLARSSFLGLHRQQVAIEHRRRLHERLAEREERASPSGSRRPATRRA